MQTSPVQAHGAQLVQRRKQHAHTWTETGHFLLKHHARFAIPCATAVQVSQATRTRQERATCMHRRRPQASHKPTTVRLMHMRLLHRSHRAHWGQARLTITTLRPGFWKTWPSTAAGGHNKWLTRKKAESSACQVLSSMLGRMSAVQMCNWWCEVNVDQASIIYCCRAPSPMGDVSGPDQDTERLSMGGVGLCQEVKCNLTRVRFRTGC